MKKRGLFLVFIFLLATGISFQRADAQDKSKEEKEKELQMQEAINAQKKAVADQKKAQEEAQKSLEEQKSVIEKAMKNYELIWNDTNRFNRQFRPYRDPEDLRRDRPFYIGEPMMITPGIDVFKHFNGESEGTTWDFSKYVKETTFSRDYTFDVESTANTVVMAVNGDCKSGEIRIKIIMPNGKTYSDIVIDDAGNLNWRKSFVISDTENKDKAGPWEFEINSQKATGYFKISLQTY
jgi:type II secretory pathway pseudopilin PulG